MKKFWTNFKKYYPLLLGAVVPLIIFILPVYATSYIDEIDTVTYVYNFYDLFSLRIDNIFASLNLLILLSSVVNLILFIIYMCDSYKLLLYKNLLNRLLLTFAYIMLIASLLILIYSIIVSSRSSSDIFVYSNKFYIGSVVLILFSIVQTVFITIKYRKNQI